MRRSFSRVLVFSILGAITSVAVAWACALWSETSSCETEVRYQPGSVLQRRFSIRPFGATSFDGRQARSIGNLYVHSTVTQFDLKTEDFRISTVNLYQHGWPFLCLTGENRFGYHVERNGLCTIFLMPGSLSGRPRMVAFGVMPFPFLVDSIVFALPLWLLLVAPSKLRSMLRERRGCCARCGYDLSHADHDACPECGALIPSPLRERARVRVR